MKRGLGLLLVTVVSLAGNACKKSNERAAPPPPNVEITPGDAAAAAVADPWTAKAAKKDPLAHPFLWSADKDGKTIYLLGTMHMGVDAEVRLPQVVWDKLDAAKIFAMEADTSDPKLMSAMLRSGGSLRDDLGDDYWTKLVAAVGPGLGAQLERMKPMGAAALLALKDLPKTPPMDGVLLGRAINQSKQIVYLELGSLQAELLEKHMDLKALKMMIDLIDTAAAESKAMLDAYTEGDADKIVKLNDKQKADSLAHGYTEAQYEAQMDDMLYKRNASWIAPLEKLHADGGGFVAVGALHLIGPKSVLELLGARGFKIARVAP